MLELLVLTGLFIVLLPVLWVVASTLKLLILPLRLLVGVIGLVVAGIVLSILLPGAILLLCLGLVPALIFVTLVAAWC